MSKTKIERMHQHVVDDCVNDGGRTIDECNASADRVVSRYQSNKIIEKWERNQQEHLDDTATPESKK